MRRRMMRKARRARRHVIVIAFAEVEDEELAGFEPTVVPVDRENRPR